VETPGNNRKQVMFGAVNSRSGQTHFQLSAHKRSARLWRPAVRRSPNRPRLSAGGLHLLVIVDGASIYKSKSTLAWLKERPRIVLVPLPSYAPKLNLQEQVWRWLRAVVTHNHYFGSLDAAIAAAKRFFAKLVEQPEAVLRLIGLTGPPLQRALAGFT